MVMIPNERRHASRSSSSTAGASLPPPCSCTSTALAPSPARRAVPVTRSLLAGGSSPSSSAAKEGRLPAAALTVAAAAARRLRRDAPRVAPAVAARSASATAAPQLGDVYERRAGGAQLRSGPCAACRHSHAACPSLWGALAGRGRRSPLAAAVGGARAGRGPCPTAVRQPRAAPLSTAGMRPRRSEGWDWPCSR